MILDRLLRRAGGSVPNASLVAQLNLELAALRAFDPAVLTGGLKHDAVQAFKQPLSKVMT
jgi:hypothetical protein